MAKQVKDRYIGARVGPAKEAQINAYVEASDDLNIGELIRLSVDEFMLSHPLKNPRKRIDATAVTKPGE